MVPEEKEDRSRQALETRLHLVDEVRPEAGLPDVLAYDLLLELHRPLRPVRMDSKERSRSVLPRCRAPRREGERPEGTGDPQGIPAHSAP
jgi:hypothetical protein